jgi:hypothetical protein
VQTFVIGGVSTCEPGAAHTQQLQLVCWINAFPTAPNTVWGPEVPSILPSIAFCPPVIGLNIAAAGTVIVR